MICAIVPAAGRSRRMGSPKQLLPFGERTVIGHIVDQLRASKLAEIYVVVGEDGQRIAAELSSRLVRLVTNPAPEADMLSSVRSGLRALPNECAAVLVALGDQPAVTTKLIDAMIAAFHATGKRIVVPACGGRRGHPLLFSGDFRQEVLARYDGIGLRGLLEAHGDEVLELDLADPAVLSDIDSPEDYARQVARLEDKQPWPQDRKTHERT